MQHVDIWVKLLKEKWVEGNDWTIMPCDYFVTPHDLTTWSPWAQGTSLQKEPPTIPWWTIEKVIIIINSLHLLLYVTQ